MTYATIRYDLADKVATITLDRPDRLNAISLKLFEEVSDALDKALAEGARAILLTGEGRAFCSGADLQDAGGLPEDPGELLDSHYNPLAEKFASLPIPVVTAVNGLAAGAGCSVALWGDYVLAARSAYFLLAFVNIGLVPDAGATWLVARAVGRARALEMMLLGERVPAEKAEAWGLINRAVDDEALLGEARAVATRLAKGPTKAISLIRNSVRRALGEDLTDVLARERADQKTAGQSADFKEGVAAFLEKRPARYEGK
ncbi:enoyl-CoA hydratase PaaG [Sphingomonas sp. MM-1]|uniref:enoyl-CoA hydratase-related protein n=1 Tax=Sphingomonas sp. MM-1 TaxID=745310 RepID=UPI0002C055B1|nr:MULTISPECIES: enoyl-CoA hydratase-related protein [unclassified Sphingomonas]AGH49919.1 enoyl-CoA hydratase PaaG [Sphingomonas sp. MM-1]MDX3883219.1 enoyl-CoA hydratase-related protein [Sphingomonas sp.]